MNKKKVKLFTHNDLDGLGCLFLFQLLPNMDVDFELLDGTKYEEKKILKFFEENNYINYDFVYITDLVIKNITADEIQKKCPERTKLFDHHKTCLYLNKYSWATIKNNENLKATCGTQIVFNYFNNLNMFKHICSETFSNLKNFVEKVNRYDTWLWVDYNDLESKQLSDLISILGIERFCQEIKGVKFDVSSIINKYIFILKLEQEKINRYINFKNQQIINKNISGYNVGIVFAEQYLSELGNALARLNPEFDIIMLISDHEIKLRSIKENASCDKFAKEIFNGGGQPKASGATIPISKQYQYIDLILNKK